MKKSQKIIFTRKTQREVTFTAFLKANFLPSQKLLAAMFLQKKSSMQVLAASILIRIPIVKLACEWFLS